MSGDSWQLLTLRTRSAPSNYIIRLEPYQHGPLADAVSEVSAWTRGFGTQLDQLRCARQRAGVCWLLSE